MPAGRGHVYPYSCPANSAYISVFDCPCLRKFNLTVLLRPASSRWEITGLGPPTPGVSPSRCTSPPPCSLVMSTRRPSAPDPPPCQGSLSLTCAVPHKTPCNFADPARALVNCCAGIVTDHRDSAQLAPPLYTSRRDLFSPLLLPPFLYNNTTTSG